MKTLYLDLSMGAAGDMLAAALISVLPDPEACIGELNAAGIPGVTVSLEKAFQKGICGASFRVLVNGEEELPCADSGQMHAHDEAHHHEEDAHHGHAHGEHDHAHSHHEHSHGGHDHAHRGMEEIRSIIGSLKLPEEVRKEILAVYGRIAAAESVSHGREVSEIHFHEVGAMDAVADVAAVCLALYRLGPSRIVSSPVRTGFGTVRTAHGVLPVPAPATAELLKGIPCEAGPIEGELCTPTGAALVSEFAKEFGTRPRMTVGAVGYGLGKKEFPVLNAVRAFLGETEDAADAAGAMPDGVTGETILELACNIDDMTAEEIAHAAERIAEAGAIDVFQLPCGMKKGRTGIQLEVLCREEKKDEVLAAVFRHTSTLGVRVRGTERFVLSRTEETADTKFGPVRRKLSGSGSFAKEKWEYEDLARIARENGLSIREVKERL